MCLVAGTFVLSNLGMFGVDRFDAILPPGVVSNAFCDYNFFLMAHPPISPLVYVNNVLMQYFLNCLCCSILNMEIMCATDSCFV